MDFPEDIDRLVRVVATAGWTITPEDAALAWETFSEDEYCASWIGLTGYEDTRLADIVIRYTKEGACRA